MLRVNRSAFERKDLLDPAKRHNKVRIRAAREQRSGKMAEKRILLNGWRVFGRCWVKRVRSRVRRNSRSGTDWCNAGT